ncbi:MAG: PAS domain S-box protein [Desulfobacteraceae bacterium]|nr:PAS domain S-box protein [Desulfobacteraceae bacterium]
MQDEDKAKEQLMGLRERIAELEKERAICKRTEELLQARLDRFCCALSNLHAAVLLVTEDRQVEFANKSFCELFDLECSPEELRGLSPSEMIEKIRGAYADPVGAVEHIQEILDRGLPVACEEVALRDGRTCVRDFIPLDTAGKRHGRLWHHLDITERKRAENTLQQRTFELGERVKELDCLYALSSLIETSSDSLDAIMQGVVELLPPAWQYPHLACARIEVEGQTFSTANHRQTRWQLRRPIKVRNAQVGYVEVCYLQFPPECGEEPFLPQEGKLLDVVSERLGRAIERIQIRQALREGEERFRHLIVNTVDFIWQTDEKARFVYISPQIEEILGYRPEELLGRTCFQLLDPATVESNKAAFRSAIQTNQDKVFVESRWIDKKGGIVVIETNATVVRRLDGSFGGFIGIDRDITERKRAEEERLQLEQRFHQVQKAESLGRMAGAIAHHFNNLLGATMGRLELALADLQEAPRPRGHLMEAMKASQRAAEISRLMLTYLGHTVQRKEPCNVGDAVREALLLLVPSLPRRVHVQADLPPEGIVIQGDKAHIEQTLTNLIVNAGEAIGDGDGRITVTVRVMTAEKLRRFRLFPSGWEPAESGYVSISVSDTGSGFDPATMERIFDPFFSTKFPGRGLGLPVVLGVVRAHEGALAVESRPGLGSTFHVFFPLPARQPAHPARKPTVGLKPFKAGGLVLVVEDDPVVRDMAEAMLKEFGYEVVTAGDGFEALEMFRERRDEVRVVLLDQSMPGMSGWETLAALRALRSDLPVILASGYDEAQVMRGEHSEQPQAFLHKPFRMKDLEAALDAARKA